MARAESAQRTSRPVRNVELLLMFWRLLASAQFAIALIGFLVIAGLLATVIPQVPPSIQGSPTAVDTWVEGQRDSFGVMTDAMHRLGLFNVVRTWWFIAALGALAVSVGVFIIDRFLDTWRNVTRPQEQLPDSFFDRAANRAAFVTPESVTNRLEALLSARRFKVRTATEGETTYLFADRFAWAQLGTFASHLALVMFLAGGLVSQLGGYTNAFLIPEGTSSPVFAVSHPEQMQIEVSEAVGEFDETGRPLDYRTHMVIYQGGEEVAQGYTTVNDPIAHDGYRFHQSGYFGEGAALRIRDAGSGNTVYSEVLALEEFTPGPQLVVRDATGAVVLDDVIVPTDTIEGATGTIIALPGSDDEFWVGVLANPGEETWNLIVFERGSEEAGFIVPEGESHAAGGYEWTLEEVTALPSLVSEGISEQGRTLTIMSETPEGDPFLTVLGAPGSPALTLFADQPVQFDGREYVFEGRREFAGIEVRKDPGANLIWIAAGLLLLGLMATFYLPRLRLWFRVRGDETVVASLAERRGVFQSELKHLLTELDTARIEPEGDTLKSD